MSRALCLFTLCLGACAGSDATYVVVQLERGMAPDGITTVQLDLKLAGKNAQSTLHETGGAPIVFPTAVALQIENGDGPMIVAATALNALGKTIAQGAGTIPVVRGKTSTLALTLGPGAPDDLAMVGDLAGAADLSDGGAQDLMVPSDLGGDMLINNSPLLGDTNVEANVDPHSNGLADASNFVANRTGPVGHLTVYYDSGNATQLNIGLYDDLGGHPHTLLAQGTIASPAVSTINSVNITPVTVTGGVTYWIALLGPTGMGTTFAFRYGTGAAAPTTTEHSSQSNLATLPPTWSSGTTFPGTFCTFYARP